MLRSLGVLVLILAGMATFGSAALLAEAKAGSLPRYLAYGGLAQALLLATLGVMALALARAAEERAWMMEALGKLHALAAQQPPKEG